MSASRSDRRATDLASSARGLSVGERDLDKLATLFYVAHALPLVRQRSEEAAVLTELALSELIVSLIGRANTLRSQTNLVDYLSYSIEEVHAIAPAGAAALQAAVRELREVAFDGDTKERRPC